MQSNDIIYENLHSFNILEAVITFYVAKITMQLLMNKKKKKMCPFILDLSVYICPFMLFTTAKIHVRKPSTL